MTAAYVDHSVDAFVPLPDGSKPYPEAMAQQSLDPASAAGVLALLPAAAAFAVQLQGAAAQPLGQPLQLVVEVTAPHKVRV